MTLKWQLGIYIRYPSQVVEHIEMSDVYQVNTVNEFKRHSTTHDIECRFQFG